ncbi:hypothetical protein K0T92_16155 [Paenibacillus oenotherae]|uniref:Uncharacterized protein n=1 Tax=Paenibacillus oenotherae TaxID=1435645 RepID=A0ABS7D8J8_9BACL|nr:hypothetical protein [Paenibacillus oenotherae]MBW7476270.1 hypothetical protein [Paenibacillus oenotherae]
MNDRDDNRTKEPKLAASGSVETCPDAEEKELLRFLERYTVEVPTVKETAQFAEGLLQQWERTAAPAPAANMRKPLYILRIIQSHLKLFQWSFWLASAAVLVLGLVADVASGTGSEVEPFIFTAPLLAALGVCFAFRAYGTPMFQLEMSLPVMPMMMIFGRLTIIITYNSAIGLLLSLFLHGADSALSLYVFSWLVPLGVSCLLALIVMLYFGLYAGVFTSIVVWSIQLWMNKHLGMLYLFSGKTNGYWIESKLIGVLCILLLTALLWFRIRRLHAGGRMAVQ